MVRWGWLVVAMAMAAPGPAPATPVTAAAEAGQYRPVVETQARVVANRETTLTAPVAMAVTSVAVEVGALVAKGERLGRVRAPELAARRARVASLQRALSLARKSARSVTESVREGAATRADALTAQAVVARAEADLAGARGRVAEVVAALGGSRPSPDGEESGAAPVIAPFAGVVTQRPSPGAHLAASTLLFHLAAIDPVDLEVAVARGELPAWQGGEVVVRTATGERPARLVAPTPRIDPTTGLALLRLRLANPDHALLPGGWCAVRLTSPPVAVVWVPTAAVVEREGHTYCVVRADGKTQPVPVAVAGTAGTKTALGAGLAPGAAVVIVGAYERLYHDLDQLMKFVD
jgi:RND family efflux transporter, MFP subunit